MGQDRVDPGLGTGARRAAAGDGDVPGSPLAANKEELQEIAGYWPDIAKSRAEASRLLHEAGVEGLRFELVRRSSDQPAPGDAL